MKLHLIFLCESWNVILFSSQSGHNIGRDAFLYYSIIIPLSRLFNDDLDIVRRNAHMAMEMLCRFTPGAEGVVEASLIPTLVDKLKTELDEIKVSELLCPALVDKLKTELDKSILSELLYPA